MTQLLAHLELVLTILGLVVIWLVPTFMLPPTADRWRATALTAIVVGVLHATIFWLVRRRQAKVRNAAIVDIRGMLKDRVNNQLLVILMSAEMPPDEIEQLEHIQRSVNTISNCIETLSEESIKTWKGQYSIALADERVQAGLTHQGSM